MTYKNEHFMRLPRFILAVLFAATISGCANSGSTNAPLPAVTDLTVMTWNIWHGGREDDEIQGPQRVIEVIRQSQADIIAMQETYGSGELVSKALGFHFKPRGTNVSIHSRFPIIEDISVFHEFKCVGAIIELPDKTQIAFYSIWLPYNAEIWEAGTREGKTNQELLAACDASREDLQKIMHDITTRLDEGGYDEIPVIIAGDFNSMSHLDYTLQSEEQYGYVIDWPTSRVMTNAGFTDAYRTLHSDVDRVNDRTWTPRFPDQQQDRIDFIYFKSSRIRAHSVIVVDEHPIQFPSDHAALVVKLKIDSATPQH